MKRVRRDDRRHPSRCAGGPQLSRERRARRRLDRPALDRRLLPQVLVDEGLAGGFALVLGHRGPCEHRGDGFRGSLARAQRQRVSECAGADSLSPLRDDSAPTPPSARDRHDPVRFTDRMQEGGSRRREEIVQLVVVEADRFGLDLQAGGEGGQRLAIALRSLRKLTEGGAGTQSPRSAGEGQ